MERLNLLQVRGRLHVHLPWLLTAVACGAAGLLAAVLELQWPVLRAGPCPVGPSLFWLAWSSCAAAGARRPPGPLLHLDQVGCGEAGQDLR